MRCWLFVPILLLGSTAVALADNPPAGPIGSTPAVVIPSNEMLVPPTAGCSSCDARGNGNGAGYGYGNSKLAAKLKERPEPECFGCSTLRCEWRFIFGSCRAFYGEGRFRPATPPIFVEP